MSLSSAEQQKLKRFGENLRALRLAQGLTQEKLAEKADMNPRALQKVEAAHVSVTLTTILRLQKALGCTIQDMFGGM